MRTSFQLMLGAAAAVCACTVALGEPVNSKCPISGKSFDEPAATVEVEGRTVGFCCPGCIGAFEEWPDEKKMQFIETSLEAKQQDLGQDKPGAGAAAKADIGDPYPLPNCPISGQELGSMGDPVVKSYDGREVRYCCERCTGRFEKDLQASFAKVDEKIIKSQQPYYPLETCVACGHQLDAKGEPVDFVYRNRLIRACCDSCKEQVLANPVPAWRMLDAAVKQAQGPHYPLEMCIVSDERLGSMGKPVERVVANRLVMLCCNHCEDQLKEDPAAAISKIDAAWEERYGKQRPDITIEKVKEGPRGAGS